MQSTRRSYAPDVGITALWYAWDTSLPTLEIMGIKCIRPHPTFATFIFRWAVWEACASPDLFAKFKGRSRVGKEMCETWVEQIGDGKGTEGEKTGIGIHHM